MYLHDPDKTKQKGWRLLDEKGKLYDVRGTGKTIRGPLYYNSVTAYFAYKGKFTSRG